MMMKLKLIAMAFGAAQAATKVCVGDGAFDGTISAKFGGTDPVTCEAMQGKLSAFTASAKSCAGNISLGSDGSKPNAGMMMGILSVCCKTGVDVCRQYSLNPCATPSDFKPKHTFDNAGEQMTCLKMTSMLPAMTPSASSCAAKTKIGDNMLPAAVMTAMLGSNGCCSQGKAACEQFSLNPCAVASDFKQKHTFLSEGTNTTCGQVAAMFPAMTPSATSCAAKVQMGKSKMPVSSMSTFMSSNGCCSAGKDACVPFTANPCADKTKFMPKNTLDGNASGTSCALGMSVLFAAPFVADKVTCAVSITVSGTAMTRAVATAQVAPFCCSDKVSACAASAATVTSATTDTKVTGSISMSATGLTETQMNSAAKAAVAAHFGVDLAKVKVTVTKSRRLSATPRNLAADTWTVAYEFTVPAAKKAAVEAKVTALATPAGKAALKTIVGQKLVDAGAPQAAVKTIAVTAATGTAAPAATTGTTGTASSANAVLGGAIALLVVLAQSV